MQESGEWRDILDRMTLQRWLRVERDRMKRNDPFDRIPPAEWDLIQDRLTNIVGAKRAALIRSELERD